MALDLLPSNESIILTVYDFHFCIWKNNIDVIVRRFRCRSSAAWWQKGASIQRDAGVPVGPVSASLENPTAPSIFGISWINLTNGPCSTQSAPLVSAPWSSMSIVKTSWQWALNRAPCTSYNYHSLSSERWGTRTKQWTNIGREKSKAWNTSTKDCKEDLSNHRNWGLRWILRKSCVCRDSRRRRRRKMRSSWSTRNTMPFLKRF